jgi:hypothetical protein
VADELNRDDEPTAENGNGEEHGFKEDFRGAVAKVVGIAIEAGSMLAGQSGEIVSAEGRVAEADTEHLIDRIDGEG